MRKEIQWLCGLFVEHYFSIKGLDQIFKCDFIFLELPKWAEQLLGLRFSFCLIYELHLIVNLLLFLPRMGIAGKSTFLVWILPLWVYIQCVVARSSFRPSLALYWGPPRICIHNLTGARHPLLWFFTALLCRWHSAVPVFFPLDEPLSLRQNLKLSLTHISWAPNRTISSLLFISYFTPSL